MTRTLSLLATGLALALSLPAGAQPPAPATPAPTTATEPDHGLTPRILYTFLLAEIAGGRGETEIASQAYLDLAQRTRDPRIARRAVEVSLYARNMSAATEAARIWTETEPNSEEARRLLASLQAGGDGQLEQVEAQLARLLARAPEQLDNHLLGLHRAFSRIPDRAAVRGVIQRLTEPYLEHPEAHFARAQAALAAADTAAAMAALEEALRREPDWEPAILFKAQVLSQTDALKDATQLVREYLERHPDSRLARLAYARALVSQRAFEAARTEFRTLLAGAPDDLDLLYAVGLLAAQLEDYPEAETHLKRALEGGHAEADGIRVNLGQIAERRNEREAARGWYASVPKGRHYLEAQLRIANLLADQGKLTEARNQLHGIEAADEDDRKRIVLTEIQFLQSKGDTQAAFEVIDGALRGDPDDQDLLYESSMLAESLGQHDVMEGRLRKLIALQPDHAHAHNALGYSLAERGIRLEEAEQLIARALELKPNDPYILDSLGWVRFRRADPQAALTHLERAYGIRRDPEIAAHLGEVLWSLERRADASRIWNDALKSNPDNRALKAVIKRLRGE